MIRHDVPVYECDQCHHRWLSESDKLPQRCPSRKCRSVKWHQSFVDQVIERGKKIGAVSVNINGIEIPIPGVSKASDIPATEWKHDKKKCRIYNCQLCKKSK